ncbi:hypothetical protein [uncultured Psychrobacter sp.]|uniref:hypothetical protein n=1 Tax=uncultured Psychrobacter sp. TaxID=259303 RepID=UPI0030DB11FD
MFSNRYLCLLDEHNKKSLKDKGLKATIWPIEYMPTLHEHQYVGGIGYYPAAKNDEITKDNDTATPIHELVSIWALENKVAVSDMMWWGVYYNTRDKTFYTQDNSNHICAAGSLPLGFIHLIKPVAHYHQSSSSKSELYKNETSHVKDFLEHTSMAQQNRVFQIVLYNLDGEEYLSRQYVPAPDNKTLNNAVRQMLIERKHD